MRSGNHKYSRIGIIALSAAIAFTIVSLAGEIMGSWGSNTVCYKYLGCTDGFFGYDAIEHLLFGLGLVWTIVWFCKKFPQYSILNEKRCKTVFIILASVALISVAWEFIECAHDVFRLEVLHEPLLNIKLHTNFLDQPSNLDTMGDLAFSLLGAIFALFFI